MSKEEKNLSSIKCVWMASNVIDYKLCDRNFDCENCLFDKAMRNNLHNYRNEIVSKQLNRFKKVIERIIASIEKDKESKNVIYLKNHLSIKKIIDNKFYLGLSPLALKILEDFSIEKSDKNIFGKNEKFVEIKGSWGEVSITAPFSFKVLDYAISDNYNSKWIAIAELNEDEIQQNMLSALDYQNDIMYLSRELYHQYLNTPDIGPTIYDGGKEIQFLHQIIGKEKYNDILNHLFAR